MPDNPTPPPFPPAAPPPLNPAPPPSPENQMRTWNMLCHLSALAGFIGIPLGNILGPLIVWLLKKNEFPSVDVHGKAAMNFQITITLAAIVVSIGAYIGTFFCIGVLLFPVVLLILLAGLIFSIVAAVKANNGEDYKYPWSLELIK